MLLGTVIVSSEGVYGTNFALHTSRVLGGEAWGGFWGGGGGAILQVARLGLWWTCQQSSDVHHC